jgi:phosphatidylglycerophosphatase A
MTVHKLIATWFGLGLMPRAPGTFGSLGALPFAYLIISYAGLSGLIVAIIAVSLIGWWAADKVGRESGEEDNQIIVVDEVAGQWVALLVAGLNIKLIIAAFLLFRLFDVIKPWPVSRCEKLPGATGVMADDIAAGFYALLCLVVLRYAGFS